MNIFHTESLTQFIKSKKIDLTKIPYGTNLLFTARKKVGKPFSRLSPYLTVRALLRHTAYPYVILITKKLRSRQISKCFFIMALLKTT